MPARILSSAHLAHAGVGEGGVDDGDVRGRGRAAVEARQVAGGEVHDAERGRARPSVPHRVINGGARNPVSRSARHLAGLVSGCGCFFWERRKKLGFVDIEFGRTGLSRRIVGMLREMRRC